MKTFLLSFLLVIGLGATAQKQHLQLNLKAGQTYTRSLTSKMTSKQNINGRQMDLDISTTARLLFKVNSILNNKYVMDVSYDEISMNMNMPGMKLGKDSGGVDFNAMINIMTKSMIGKKFTIEMSRTGKVVHASIDDLFAGFFAALPHMDASTRQKVESAVKQNLGGDAFKTNIEAMSAYFPEGPVAKGESWKISTPIPSSAQTNFTMTYKLEDITDRHYIVSGTGSMSPNEGSPSIDVNGMSMKQRMTGSNTTNIKINKATGWIQEAELNQQIKGDFAVNKSDKSPKGMNIQMETSSVVRITE